ncbi:MAG: DUF2292 domain-containing protein [Oscillospiraceae bacterium]|nr:DUF2292 domain-containing protein [Oscillospiraceae bacterium]
MPEKPSLVLSEKERKLIELIRKLKHGEIRVIIKDAGPVRVENIKESILL